MRQKRNKGDHCVDNCKINDVLDETEKKQWRSMCGQLQDKSCI